jgi:hypothetical protein
MSSTDDKITKLRALMNDPAATAGERAAARERIAAIKNTGRGMSDAELAGTNARLKDERRDRASQKGEAGGDRALRARAQQALQKEAQGHD